MKFLKTLTVAALLAFAPAGAASSWPPISLRRLRKPAPSRRCWPPPPTPPAWQRPLRPRTTSPYLRRPTPPFAALPAGTVEDLLKPENKDKLAAILKLHVIDKILSADIADGTTQVDTLNSDVELTVTKDKTGVRSAPPTWRTS